MDRTCLLPLLPVFLFCLCPRLTYTDKSSISCECIQVLCLPITSLTCNWGYAVFPQWGVLRFPYPGDPYLLFLIALAYLLKSYCNYSLYPKLLGERIHFNSVMLFPLYPKHCKKIKSMNSYLAFVLHNTSVASEPQRINKGGNYFKHGAI